MGALFFPEAHIENFIDEAKERFLEECDYEHEAQAQKEFALYYKDHAILHVPDVIPKYSSSKVLTTAFAAGLGFDEWLATHPSQEARNRIGIALFEFYLGTLYRFGLYNCDPHPGNYIFMADDRVAVLDHGCTRRFEPAFRTKLKALTRAIYDDHRPSLHQALLDLDIIKEGRSYDYETIRSFLRSFHGPMLEDRHKNISLGETLKLGDIMAMKQKLMKFQLPAESLFLFRIRFGLMSVLARLGAEANWHQLERSYIEKSV
ncbi:hypothetical protein KAI87_02200 [Myxococcota bacterium]|nr:hypothetical protein [Myxococcota bacterium]